MRSSTDPRIIPVYRAPTPLDLPPRSSPWAAMWLLAAVAAILVVGLLLLPLFRVG